jgi:hypothetical protein
MTEMGIQIETKAGPSKWISCRFRWYRNL